MTLLTNLKKQREQHQAQPALARETALVEEYQAAQRAWNVARAQNDTPNVLFWGGRVNAIAREMARSSLGDNNLNTLM